MPRGKPTESKGRREKAAHPSPQISETELLPVTPAYVPVEDAAAPMVASTQVLERTAPPAPQPPPMSRHARQRMLARRRVRKISRALYAIGGFAIALMWF